MTRALPAVDRVARGDRRLPAQRLPGRRLRQRAPRQRLRERARRLRRHRRALDRGHPDPARRARHLLAPHAQARAARRPPRHARGRDLDRLRARALRRARRLRRRAQAGQAARVAGPAQPQALPGPARGGDRRDRAARRDGRLRHPDRVRRVPLQQRRGAQLLHPQRAGHDGLDPRLEHEGGQDLPRRLGLGHQPVEHPRLDGAAEQGRHRVGPGVVHARRRLVGRARSSPAARRGARRRWSCSTSTTRTSASSSGARPRRRRRPTRCATPASTCRSTARASRRSSTRTPTTRCACPTTSCAPSSTTTTGTSSPARPASRSATRSPRASSCARSPRRPGSAPIRACSTTPRSISGTRARCRVASTRPTRASRPTPASHTTQGLLPIGELIARGEGGEQLRVYTHRATADAPAGGVIATRPIAFMRNGVKPVVRLRFANGAELRCTPNHRLWTLNRGYVRADELDVSDRVLLNDTATPAVDASWALPIKVKALAKSAARGGKVAYRQLPERWSEGLGELTGHLIGDGWLTDVQTGWIYGGDDIADGHVRLARGNAARADRWRSRARRCPTERCNCAPEAQPFESSSAASGVTSARASDKRVPHGASSPLPPRSRPRSCAASSVRTAVSRGSRAGGKANALRRARQPQRGARSRTSSGCSARSGSAVGSIASPSRTSRPSPTRASTAPSCEYTSRQGFDLRITGGDLERFADVDRVLRSAQASHTRGAAQRNAALRHQARNRARLPRGRRAGGGLQPHRAPRITPTSSTGSSSPTAASTCTSTTRPATSRR